MNRRQDVRRWNKHRMIKTLTLPYRRTCPSDHLRRTTLEALLSPEHTSIKRSTIRWAILGSRVSSKGHQPESQQEAYGDKRVTEIVVVLSLLLFQGRCSDTSFVPPRVVTSVGSTFVVEGVSLGRHTRTLSPRIHLTIRKERSVHDYHHS